MNRQNLIEQLAEKEHGSWSHWMKYLFSKCTPNGDGSVAIPANLVERWTGQANTSYADLTEKEKQSDRNRVALILPLIEAYKRRMSVRKKWTLQIAASVLIFTGGMIAGQLLLFRDVLLASPWPRGAYLVEDGFFFLSAGIIAILTFRVWWPVVWWSSNTGMDKQ